MQIQKLRKQNQNLKKQLKQLNEQLNKIIEKVQNKSRWEQQQKTSDGRLDIIKKQLQNQIKKNGILKKEIDQMKYKEKYLQGYKVDDLKNIIKEKDKIIEELNAKIKLYQKLDRQEKNGDSYKKEEELTQKIMQQNQEIVHLKKKQADFKKNEQQLEKTVKTLRQQIGLLQSKSPQKSLQSKSKQKVQTSIITKQEYDKLNQKYKQLQSSKKMNDKSSKQQIQSLTLKLKNYQREFIELKDQVAKKEKEGNILMFKLKEKERKNYNTMEPIKTVRYSEEILHSSNLFENRKEFKGLTFGQGVYREFDDSKLLPLQKNYRIKKVTFTHFEQHILSLTTQYEIIDNNESSKEVKKTTKVIQSFAIGSQYTNIKAVQYAFLDYQYIASFQIYTLKAIELIRIVTSKEETIEVGNTKNIPKYKKHAFDIRNHQKPISFMGVIENKRVNGDSKEYLISLGAEIRRKEVFIRSKSNKKQDSLHRKSFLDKLNGKAVNQLQQKN